MVDFYKLAEDGSGGRYYSSLHDVRAQFEQECDDVVIIPSPGMETVFELTGSRRSDSNLIRAFFAEIGGFLIDIGSLIRP